MTDPAVSAERIVGDRRAWDAARRAQDVPAAPRYRHVTVVATVRVFDGTNPDTVGAVVDHALRVRGFDLVPCDWAPDPDTIADAIDGTDGGPVTVDVIDLNPARPDRPDTIDPL